MSIPWSLCKSLRNGLCGSDHFRWCVDESNEESVTLAQIVWVQVLQRYHGGWYLFRCGDISWEMFEVYWNCFIDGGITTILHYQQGTAIQTVPRLTPLMSGWIHQFLHSAARLQFSQNDQMILLNVNCCMVGEPAEPVNLETGTGEWLWGQQSRSQRKAEGKDKVESRRQSE